MAVSFDADDLEREQVALPRYFPGVTDAPVDHLGDVDQALDGALDAGEGAECDELRHESGHYLPLLVLVDDGIPLLRVGPSQAEGDPLVLRVDLGHVDIDFVAHLEELRRRLVALPRELREVGEAVCPAEVDEDAEAAHAADATLADVAFVQLFDEAFLLREALLLESGAFRKDDSVATPVDLDHFEAELTADHVGHVAAVIFALGRSYADDL